MQVLNTKSKVSSANCQSPSSFLLVLHVNNKWKSSLLLVIVTTQSNIGSTHVEWRIISILIDITFQMCYKQPVEKVINS